MAGIPPPLITPCDEFIKAGQCFGSWPNLASIVDLDEVQTSDPQLQPLHQQEFQVPRLPSEVQAPQRQEMHLDQPQLNPQQQLDQSLQQLQQHPASQAEPQLEQLEAQFQQVDNNNSNHNIHQIGLHQQLDPHQQIDQQLVLTEQGEPSHNINSQDSLLYHQDAAALKNVWDSFETWPQQPQEISTTLFAPPTTTTADVQPQEQQQPQPQQQAQQQHLHNPENSNTVTDNNSSLVPVPPEAVSLFPMLADTTNSTALAFSFITPFVQPPVPVARSRQQRTTKDAKKKKVQARQTQGKKRVNESSHLSNSGSPTTPHRPKKRKARCFAADILPAAQLDPANSKVHAVAVPASPNLPRADFVGTVVVDPATTVVAATTPPTGPVTTTSCSSSSSNRAVAKKGNAVLQCMGMNRKKKTRCRNAALMEFVGPQPIYCAEHISLDQNALYHKCGFPLQPGQPKKCKEIVFKDFRYCFKHVNEWLMQEFVGVGARSRTQSILGVASQLLSQLEVEAAQAKISDGELYQRKSKLVPKYQSMVRSFRNHLDALPGDDANPVCDSPNQEIALRNTTTEQCHLDHNHLAQFAASCL